MNTIITTSDFDDWFATVSDRKVKGRILARITGAEQGNFGECDPVGEGVSEMKIHIGPGFRIYYVRNGLTVYVLLCGGDKHSQGRDIEKAKGLARELKEARK